jgi:hypothetical protein
MCDLRSVKQPLNIAIYQHFISCPDHEQPNFKVAHCVVLLSIHISWKKLVSHNTIVHRDVQELKGEVGNVALITTSLCFGLQPD